MLDGSAGSETYRLDLFERRLAAAARSAGRCAEEPTPQFGDGGILNLRPRQAPTTPCACRAGASTRPGTTRRRLAASRQRSSSQTGSTSSSASPPGRPAPDCVPRARAAARVRGGGIAAFDERDGFHGQGGARARLLRPAPQRVRQPHPHPARMHRRLVRHAHLADSGAPARPGVRARRQNAMSSRCRRRPAGHPRAGRFPASRPGSRRNNGGGAARRWPGSGLRTHLVGGPQACGRCASRR